MRFQGSSKDSIRCNLKLDFQRACTSRLRITIIARQRPRLHTPSRDFILPMTCLYAAFSMPTGEREIGRSISCVHRGTSKCADSFRPLLTGWIVSVDLYNWRQGTTFAFRKLFNLLGIKLYLSLYDFIIKFTLFGGFCGIGVIVRYKIMEFYRKVWKFTNLNLLMQLSLQ